MEEILIKIDSYALESIKLLAQEICKAKSSVNYYRFDNNSILTRYTRGLLGELAVETFLGVPVVERIADDQSHNHPDIQSMGWGVKTFRSKYPPLIERVQTYNQIFVRCDADLAKCKTAKCFICGYATPEIMMANLDDSKVMDKKVLQMGYKSAFVGLDKLLPINKEEILKGIKQNGQKTIT